MQYTYTELAAYLLLYSFIGWTLEVAFFAVKERRFCNRGFFSLPLCPEYGIMMDILILLLPEQGTKWLLQFLTTWMVVSVVEYFSGGIAAKIWKKHLWNYEDVTLFGGKKKSVLLSLIKAAVVMTAVLLLHPPVFILFSMIPTIVLRIIDIVGFGLMAADLVSILIAVRKSRSLTELKETQGRLLQEQKEVKQKLGGKIYHAVWKRLNRAYPEMEALEEADRAERYVFARGVCVDKLIWVFMICAFLGDLIETLFCRVTGGVWMSRSSVIYGTFSIVWGFGAVILTVVLQRLAGKEDRYIFLAGSVLGGVYEYLCSVFTEIFLGTTFWDYSDMPFNIGGRTNLLYCIFWGLLSVVWVKICYPMDRKAAAPWSKNCDLGSYCADELRCGDFSRRHGTLCRTAGQRGGAGEQCGRRDCRGRRKRREGGKRRGRRDCRRHGKYHRNRAGGKEERDRHIL